MRLLFGICLFQLFYMYVYMFLNIILSEVFYKYVSMKGNLLQEIIGH